MIVEISKSNKSDKKLKAVINDNKTIKKSISPPIKIV